MKLFLVSFLSVVVAGWSLLDAGAPTDGPARKPALRDVTIDGNAVHVSLDRDRVPAGAAANLTLTASKAMDVRVMVLEQTGSPMARSMPPPRQVSSEIVHLSDAPFLMPVALAGPTQAAGTDPLSVAGSATQYTLMITSTTGKDGGFAAIPLFAYAPEAYQLTVDAPPPGKAGDPIDVVVHVKSLADKKLDTIQITSTCSFATLADAPTIGLLAPGAETTVTLHGTRVAPGDSGRWLAIYGNALYGGTAGAYLTLDDHGAVTAAASEPYENQLGTFGVAF